MPKWHRNSIFGDGPRQPLDRNSRARFKFLLRLHRSALRLTANDVAVGEVLVSALGDDGQLDPSHQTIADRALCAIATVKRALVRLRDLGLVSWTRRLVRVAEHRANSTHVWRVEQTSNSYCLSAQIANHVTAAHSDRPVERYYVKKPAMPSSSDAEARQSAIRQLTALGCPVPPAWQQARICE